MSHREQWRAYIIGLTTGKVPRDVDLLSDEVYKIQGDLDFYITRCDSNRLSTATKDSGLGASLDGSSLGERRPTTVNIYHATCPCKLDPPKLHFYLVKLEVFALKTHCGYAVQPSERGGSIVFPSCMFLIKRKKNATNFHEKNIQSQKIYYCNVIISKPKSQCPQSTQCPETVLKFLQIKYCTLPLLLKPRICVGSGRVLRTTPSYGHTETRPRSGKIGKQGK